MALKWVDLLSSADHEYDNTISGLAATKTKTALDELAANAPTANDRIRYVAVRVFDVTVDNATGDKKASFHIPPAMDGMNLTYVHAEVDTAGTTGTEDIQIHNEDNALDMLSTKLTIDTTPDTGSDQAAAPAVINTSNDHVNTNDVIRIDVDAVHTTPAKGLVVTMGFSLP